MGQFVNYGRRRDQEIHDPPAVEGMDQAAPQKRENEVSVGKPAPVQSGLCPTLRTGAVFGFIRPVKARRLGLHEKIQVGDWYKIPCNQTLFRVGEGYTEVGMT